MSENAPLVLVTGANGFVGSHLTEALLARGYRVRCLVRPTSDLTHIKDLPVEWALGEMTDAESLRRACQGVEMVCHCAARTRALDLEAFLKVNAWGTKALARAGLEENPALRRFLYVSSHGAAGPSGSAEDYLDETRTPQPVEWYSESKLAAEEALLSMGEHLPLTIVRPAIVFGPRDRDFLSYFKWIKWGLRLELGGGERSLNVIYVHDLVALIILALENDAAAGQIYFGTGDVASFEEFTASAARALGKRALRIVVPEAMLKPIVLSAKVQERLTGRPALLNEQRVRNMIQPYWLCSGEKARQELGFVPKCDLERAVQETADWYRENGWL